MVLIKVLHHFVPIFDVWRDYIIPAEQLTADMIWFFHFNVTHAVKIMRYDAKNIKK